MNASYMFFAAIFCVLFAMAVGYLLIARMMKRRLAAAAPAHGHGATGGHGHGAAHEHRHVPYQEPWLWDLLRTVIIWFLAGCITTAVLWVWYVIDEPVDVLYLAARYGLCSALWLWALAAWQVSRLAGHRLKNFLFYPLLLSLIPIGLYITSGYTEAPPLWEAISYIPGGEWLFPPKYAGASVPLSVYVP